MRGGFNATNNTPYQRPWGSGANETPLGTPARSTPIESPARESSNPIKEAAPTIPLDTDVFMVRFIAWFTA